MDADEHTDQRNDDGQRGGHHVRQVLRLTEEAEDDRVQRKLAHRQEHDERPVEHRREDDRRVTTELGRADLVPVGEGPHAMLDIVELSLVGLDLGPQPGDLGRRALVDPLHLLLAVRDQRLLERRRRVRAHLGDVAFPVLLALGQNSALVGEVGRRRLLLLRARQAHDDYASCFLRTELSSSIRNLTLSSTVSSVEDRSVILFITAW